MHVLCGKYQAQCYGGLKIKTMILRKSCTRESDIKKDNPTHMCRKLDLKNAHCCFTLKKKMQGTSLCVITYQQQVPHKTIPRFRIWMSKASCWINMAT